MQEPENDPISKLVMTAQAEIKRLAAAKSVNAKDELQFNVWPFFLSLLDGVSAVMEALYAEMIRHAGSDGGETIPVALVARTTVVLARLIEAVKVAKPALFAELFGETGAILRELAALVDPAELAALLPATLPDGAQGGGEAEGGASVEVVS